MEMQPRRMREDRLIIDEQLIRQNPKFEGLRNVLLQEIVQGGGPGALAQLERLLRREPQRNGKRHLRYLVTSGMAVELITGFQRHHHDLDLVVMDASHRGYWEIYGTDNVTPDRYWAEMYFDPAYLEETARVVETRPGDSDSLDVEVVHPAIMTVQKLSNAFGRPPREKDIADVRALIRHWKRVESRTESWNPVAQYALEALPPSQVDTTSRRLREALQRFG